MSNPSDSDHSSSDVGELVTPGFVQALSVWGSYVRRGGGPMKPNEYVAWYLFEQYGLETPLRPPTVDELDALERILKSSSQPARHFSRGQLADLALARSYLEAACATVTINEGRPPNTPYTLKEAADALLSQRYNLPKPNPMDAAGATASAWSTYEVVPSSVLDPEVWYDNPDTPLAEQETGIAKIMPE